MNWIFLWAFPDGATEWREIGWVEPGWDAQRHEWTDIYPVIRGWPASDAGYWFARPQTGADRIGRYERGSGPARVVEEMRDI